MPYTPFAAGQRLPAADIDSLIYAETLAWTNLVDIGSFVSGFTSDAPPARMRKLMKAGTEVWEFEGRIKITSLTAGTLTTVYTFNTGYRVGSERGYQQYASNAGGNGMFVAFLNSGLLRIVIPTAGGGSVTGFVLDGIAITNPLI